MLLQQKQQQQELLYHPSIAAAAVHSYRSPAGLLGMQWTYDGAGLLLSDAGGYITMLHVQQHKQQQVSRRPAAFLCTFSLS